MKTVTDPLHQPSPPGVRWTTNNFAEALPGVPTPLTWGVWQHAMTEAAFDVFHRFGAFSRRDIMRWRAEGVPVVGIFFGHVAGNIDLMSEAVARLPGFDPGAFEHQLFGLDPAASPVRRSRRRWPVVIVRAPVSIARIRHRLTRARSATDSWWRTATTSPCAPEHARAVLQQSRDRFAGMLAAHSLQSQLAQGAFDGIARLAVEAGKPGLERHLVTGYGGVEEAELAHDLWAVSRHDLALTEFLARHGFHGPNEGELASRSWREDATPVIGAARTYADELDEHGPDALTRRQDAERRVAERELLGALPRRRRPATRLLLRVARDWIARRELGKAGFLQAIDGGRAAARAIGQDLVARGRTDEPEDVCFLTYDEVMGGVPEDVRELAAARRDRRAAYREITLPPVWVGDPAPLADPMPVGADAPGPAAASVLIGVPVAPGRVVARARVAPEAADCGVPVGRDEVLVTRTTDPSWVSMFLTAGGLAIDVGGPMSHGAIVARELGIPCVINTRDGTSRIPDGARVELDGDRGTVRILE